MKSFELASVLILVSALALPATEPSSVPKPIPATRPELKVALEALKERQPRIPLPALPETWGGGGGLGLGQDPAARLDSRLADRCFWVVSRGNNCHYCLGHQELKLRSTGIDDDAIAALDSDWSGFDPRAQAALTFARKLTLEPELVGDADFAELKKVLTNAEIIALAFTIAQFNAANRWTDGIGLPHERHFGDGREITLTTPTSEPFRHAKSIVVPATRQPRLPVATLDQAQQKFTVCRSRSPRVDLPGDEAARKELASVIGERAPWMWERALAQFPENGKAYAKIWNTIMTDNHLTPRLKAELAFITAMNNHAWYAAAHAAHRLKQLGASPEDLTSLLGDDEHTKGGAAAAYRLAAKITTDPHRITDADVAAVSDNFSTQETAQIMQVICMANMFDRFTEALGLPLEREVAEGAKLSQR